MREDWRGLDSHCSHNSQFSQNSQNSQFSAHSKNLCLSVYVAETEDEKFGVVYAMQLGSESLDF